MNHDLHPAENQDSLKAIGYFKGAFPEKFGIPRQSGLVELSGYIELQAPWASKDAFDGIEDFSHLWLIWQFHLHGQTTHSKVRPPRMGGNARRGVFATRSPFRPNGLGLSCVRNQGIKQNTEGLKLLISGADLVDGTPILDIKPYIPYCDGIANARADFAAIAPTQVLDVVWTDGANRSFQQLCGCETKKREISECLSYDPRPSYQKNTARSYGMQMHSLEIRWQICENSANCIEIINVEQAG